MTENESLIYTENVNLAISVVFLTCFVAIILLLSRYNFLFCNCDCKENAS